VTAVAFELRFAKVVVEKRVVFESRKFELIGMEVERLLENAERFLLAENVYREEIADLESKTVRLPKKSGLGLGDFVLQNENLFFREEAGGQFREKRVSALLPR
jgi:hypothetical protein